MTDKLTLNFCVIHIYDSYMVVTVNTGVNITSEHNEILKNVANTYFKNNPFVYITHRINSYSVDPAVYNETSKINNLVGFCVVSKNYMAKSAAQIEKLFLNKPFEIFDTLDEAIEWARSVIK
ncbi:hypothetical protein [Psychroserpens algicola]|uniref:STAS/SEC14 domain-containing protein n=1 Tax=Psychroserpens algicola TaxID=1719034 RepID=A0ABT0HD11_9FLAO|nr:hypothetical protein [Psychroserpens algicola]MCK8482067.1 hypothetical protein [Psychroserpens algicola]